ncbi:MAG: hypothetical protein IJK87_12140 [Prevotella sp.]|nr:hypothetical protein [Prevotella sp.]
MMEKEYIQKLLDSYMAAETNREEEKLLSNYFCSHPDIPLEWRNFSIMFRGLKQVEPKTITFHKRAILKWSATAAVVALIFGTGLFFLYREEIKEEPTKPVASIPNVSVPQVIELQDEPTIDIPIQTKQILLSNTCKHRNRKPSKETEYMTSTEECEANNRTEDNTSLENPAEVPIPEFCPPTRNLSEHRNKMRNRIQATFETPSIFIAQNSVEL